MSCGSGFRSYLGRVFARLLAALITLAVIFGAVQVAELRAAASVAAAVDAPVASAPEVDLNVPEPAILTRLPARQLVTVEMPQLDRPAVTTFVPRTFRPPRS